MTAAAGKKLDVGDRVAWSDGALGTVKEITYAAVKVQWEDGAVTLLTFGDKGTPWHEVSYVLNGKICA